VLAVGMEMQFLARARIWWGMEILEMFLQHDEVGGRLSCRKKAHTHARNNCNIPSLHNALADETCERNDSFNRHVQIWTKGRYEENFTLTEIPPPSDEELKNIKIRKEETKAVKKEMTGTMYDFMVGGDPDVNMTNLKLHSLGVQNKGFQLVDDKAMFIELWKKVYPNSIAYDMTTLFPLITFLREMCPCLSMPSRRFNVPALKPHVSFAPLVFVLNLDLDLDR
jgi:hypothetical protein